MSEIATSITEPPAVGQRALVRRGAYQLGRRGSLVREAKPSGRVPLFRIRCAKTRISCVTTSLVDLYKIGVGPSSSHTMGPMRAACRFARELGSRGLLESVARVRTLLYGSLALTGLEHATDRAVLLGLSGNEPATIDPAAIAATVAGIRAAHRIDLAGTHAVGFDQESDLIFERAIMYPPGAVTAHPNGMRFTAWDAAGAVLDERTFFSIGGGFITEDGVDVSGEKTQGPLPFPFHGAAGGTAPGGGFVGGGGKTRAPIPFPFHSAAELLATAHANELSISQLMLENECALVRFAVPDSERAPVAVVREGIERIWKTMQDCVERGIGAEG